MNITSMRGPKMCTLCGQRDKPRDCQSRIVFLPLFTVGASEDGQWQPLKILNSSSWYLLTCMLSSMSAIRRVRSARRSLWSWGRKLPCWKVTCRSWPWSLLCVLLSSSCFLQTRWLLQWLRLGDPFEDWLSSVDPEDPRDCKDQFPNAFYYDSRVWLASSLFNSASRRNCSKIYGRTMLLLT